MREQAGGRVLAADGVDDWVVLHGWSDCGAVRIAQ